MALKVVDSLNLDEKCIFCRQNVMDELLLGKVYKYEDIITHYFCMMEQNGKDEEGILGFLPSDIKKEVYRGTKLICSYCHHEGATIGCHVKQCKKKFHYPCAIENGSLHQFFGQFKSFCFAHRRVQNVPQSACKLTEKYICVVCQDEVLSKPSLSTIWAPCCKTAWFHRSCVQKMSVNAGYFFKCPNCNNKDEFRKEMRDCGIYIPDQDASWELEPNAFNELSERHSSCDAENCVCPRGRTYSTTEGIWEVILCMYCGHQGIHAKCGKLSLDDTGQWTCLTCLSITTRISEQILSENHEHIPMENPGTSVELYNINLSNSVLETDQIEKPNTRRKTRRYNKRKRNVSSGQTDDPVQSTSSQKVPKLNDSTSSTDSKNSIKMKCLFNNSGEQIQVIQLGSSQGSDEKVVEIGGVNVKLDTRIIHLDSDEDDKDSDIDTSRRNHEDAIVDSRCKENRCPSRIERTNGLALENNKLETSSYCDIIDLLDDSDDEVNKNDENTVSTTTNSKPGTPSNVVSTNNEESTSVDNDSDDDVVFVSCDTSQTIKTEENITSALIRFVENDKVYHVSPAEIKKKGGLEAITSVMNHNVPSNSTHSVRNSHFTSNNSNAVWQSIPLHKSIVRSFPQLQIVSSSSMDGSHFNNVNNNYITNNCSSTQRLSQKIFSDDISYSSDKLPVTNNIVKERVELNSWDLDSSEIIDID